MPKDNLEEVEELEQAKKKKSKDSTYEVTEVVTQTGKAYKLPNGDVVQIDELLVDIANRVYNIERSVA